MKEGHQTWNNIFMLTKGGEQRGSGRKLLQADGRLIFQNGLAHGRC